MHDLSKSKVSFAEEKLSLWLWSVGSACISIPAIFFGNMFHVFFWLLVCLQSHGHSTSSLLKSVRSTVCNWWSFLSLLLFVCSSLAVFSSLNFVLNTFCGALQSSVYNDLHGHKKASSSSSRKDLLVSELFGVLSVGCDWSMETFRLTVVCCDTSLNLVLWHVYRPAACWKSYRLTAFLDWTVPRSKELHQPSQDQSSSPSFHFLLSASGWSLCCQMLPPCCAWLGVDVFRWLL